MNCIECKDFFCKHRSQSSAGGECFYESKEQGEKLVAITTKATLEYINWSSFRREAAKDFISGFIQCGYAITDEQVNRAIEYADKLIKQLKTEQKEPQKLAQTWIGPDGKECARSNGISAEVGDKDTIYEVVDDKLAKGYDPDYLQSCIDKAKKSWEGVDVDKFMDDVRGIEYGSYWDGRIAYDSFEEMCEDNHIEFIEPTGKN